MTQRSPSRCAVVCRPSVLHRPGSSASATVAVSWPPQIAGPYRDSAASSAHASKSGTARAAVENSGAHSSAAPASSMTTASSAQLRPAPPWSGASISPGAPSSPASRAQTAGSPPAAVALSRRTSPGGLSSRSAVRALARATLRGAARRTRDGDPRLTGWHLGLSTPVIAAVNGVCAGGGLHFVVDADIVIASTAASFLDPHVSVGQASAWEAVGLSRRIPAAVAARMMLVGRHERLDAARALQVGLVSEVVEPSDLEAAAQRIGERIARPDPPL